MVGGILKEWIILIVAVASLLNFCLLLRGFKKRPGNTSDVEKGNNVESHELLELPKDCDDKSTESQPKEGEQEIEQTTVSFFMACFLRTKGCFRIFIFTCLFCCCDRDWDDIVDQLHDLRTLPSVSKSFMAFSESLVNSLREPVEREEERFF